MTDDKQLTSNYSSKYNELVDHLVSTMPSNSSPMTNNQERKSFDELYNEYSAMSIPEQLNNLKQLGRDLFNKLDAISDQLDVILAEEDYSVESNKKDS